MAQKKKSDPPAPEVSADDLEFEAEIMRRNPTRKHIRRFDFPVEVDEARAIYLVEQTGKDELAAAEAADLSMSDSERKSIHRSIDAERREGIRLTIVAMIVVDPASGQVVRRHIDQSRPLVELDDWSTKAWQCLRTFFGELNGLPVVELGNAVRGSRKVGAATPPATQQRAATATPSAG